MSADDESTTTATTVYYHPGNLIFFHPSSVKTLQSLILLFTMNSDIHTAANVQMLSFWVHKPRDTDQRFEGT